jgi:cell division transport system permease protein
VRTLKVVVALLLAVAGLAGCTLFGDDPGPTEDEQIQKILDSYASFTVILANDATDAERKNVEAALRALPGTTGVTFVNHDAAYRRMKQLFSAEPSQRPEIEPEDLPESFEVRMTDIAAVQKIRDDEGTVKSLPGVQDVIFPCTTVRECREKHSPRPTASPS